MAKSDDGQEGGKQNLAAIRAQLDRRSFFRGAAVLGGLGASGLLPIFNTPYDAYAAAAAEPQNAGATDALASQTQRILRWTGPYPDDWVRPRQGVDHNVVIVGGGQTGITLAYGLRRKGIGKVDIIERADPGQAGIWRNVARMAQLRTPKAAPGPEQGNMALSFRAWFETLNGQAAYEALDRAPRLAWADYISWFEQISYAQTRYGTRLVDVEPVGDILRLHLEVNGKPQTETTRKLVFASGYNSAGGAAVPGFIRALPDQIWSHTERPIDFTPMKGKVVGVLGAGASAFDAAGLALETGAKDVHLFNRRAYQEYANVPGAQAPRPVDRGHSNIVEYNYALPDEARWRNHLARERPVASVPFDSLNRAVKHDNFNLYLSAPWDSVSMAGGKVVVKSRGKTFRFDHIILGTGYQIDLSNQKEISNIYKSIALWGDRYKPPAGEEDSATAANPYLGTGMQFLERNAGEAPYLRNIHCANLAAQVSVGILMGDVGSMVLQPQLVAAIARDLMADNVDLAANRQFLSVPAVPSDPAPYKRSVRT